MKIRGHHLRLLTDELVYLEDGGEGISLTNDIEEVLYMLRFSIGGIGNRKVYYKDSFGEIDEVVCKKGNFVCFRKGDTAIINKIKQKLNRD